MTLRTVSAQQWTRQRTRKSEKSYKSLSTVLCLKPISQEEYHGEVLFSRCLLLVYSSLDMEQTRTHNLQHCSNHQHLLFPQDRVVQGFTTEANSKPKPHVSMVLLRKEAQSGAVALQFFLLLQYQASFSISWLFKVHINLVLLVTLWIWLNCLQQNRFMLFIGTE